MVDCRFAASHGDGPQQTLTTSTTSASNVGSYVIAASNATGRGLSNYTISCVPGVLTAHRNWGP